MRKLIAAAAVAAALTACSSTTGPPDAGTVSTARPSTAPALPQDNIAGCSGTAPAGLNRGQTLIWQSACDTTQSGSGPNVDGDVYGYCRTLAYDGTPPGYPNVSVPKLYRACLLGVQSGGYSIAGVRRTPG